MRSVKTYMIFAAVILTIVLAGLFVVMYGGLDENRAALWSKILFSLPCAALLVWAAVKAANSRKDDDNRHNRSGGSDCEAARK